MEVILTIGQEGTGRQCNLFAKYSTTQTQYSAYDTQSIMHYSISSSLTTNGFSVGSNTVLSTTDKQFIASVYPK